MWVVWQWSVALRLSETLVLVGSWWYAAVALDLPLSPSRGSQYMEGRLEKISRG